MNHAQVMNVVNTMLDRADPPVNAKCCIYKVPFDIRRLNEDAYTPKIVSIGPFRRGHPQLQNMERHKLLYCKTFRQRTFSTWDDIVSYIEGISYKGGIKPEFCWYYSDAIPLKPEELVKMILVDSCFIIELFWRYYYSQPVDDDNFISQPWVSTNIRLDLLLLENQLPFSVLEHLYDLFLKSKPIRGKPPSFIELAFDYFAHYNKSKLKPLNITIRHFTDLIRTFHLQHPPGARPDRSGEQIEHLPSATELVEAGVKIKVNTESDCCLLDLRFSGRVLEIPQLKVEDWTEILFRNMVALEQCHYPSYSYITDYVAVWDFLINTGKDVDVLVRKGVLVNWLGDNDSVANLFNSLWKNITHLNFSSQYCDICKDLNDYCRNPNHKLKATLRRDYCSTPWQTAASAAGILLLFLTVIGTVCAVLQVVQQYQSSSKTK